MSEESRVALRAKIAELQLAALGDVAQAIIGLYIRDAFEEGFMTGADVGIEYGATTVKKDLGKYWKDSETLKTTGKIFKND